jgi:hypothetical protein
MSTQKKLFGLFLAVILDIGTGLILGKSGNMAYPAKSLWFWFWGMFFSMLPDSDTYVPLGIEMVTHKKVLDSSHRDSPTHYPLMMIVPAILVYTMCNPLIWGFTLIGVIACYAISQQDTIRRARGMDILSVLFNWAAVLAPVLIIMATQDRLIGLLAIMCLSVHLAHDMWQSLEKGTGIHLLAPFSKRRWRISPRRNGWRFHMLVEVTSNEMEPLEDWLNSIFLKLVPARLCGAEFTRPTVENLFGITVFMVGITLFIRDVIINLV